MWGPLIDSPSQETTDWERNPTFVNRNEFLRCELSQTNSDSLEQTDF